MRSIFSSRKPRSTRLGALLAVALLASPTPGSAQDDSPDQHLLVEYDFDGSAVETGPYTVMVFQDARGSVTLSSEYRYSGRRAVEIRDVAGDGDFAELQGFVPHRQDGMLYFHFALMTAEPGERLNVALAGPSHFVLEKDGIAFWLGTRDGELFHHVGGEVVPLLRPLAFTWYLVDLAYDIEAGRYDLTIWQEGRRQPEVELFDQPNAVGLAGSSVFKFSFIGDPPGFDDSDVRFFVDDIWLSADRPVEQGPFVAPGRRMLFIDLWDHYRRQLYEHPECPPALEPGDFGFDDADLRNLLAAHQLDLYTALADRRRQVRVEGSRGEGRLSTLLEGMELWGRGCRAPPGCQEAPCARDFFAEASRRVPLAKLYPVSEVFALASSGHWDEADELWLGIYPAWVDDPRFPAISARLGILAGELEWAREYLDGVPEGEPAAADPLVRRLWSGELDHELALGLAAAHPTRWRDLVRTALVAEHRYYVLLWQGELGRAADYAARLEVRARRLGVSPGRWLERRGDAAFWAGDLATALAAYEAALSEHPNPTSVYLKLSDVHFRLGDHERERHYREAIYGRLKMAVEPHDTDVPP